jgi:hypothetical protein
VLDQLTGRDCAIRLVKYCLVYIFHVSWFGSFLHSVSALLSLIRHIAALLIRHDFRYGATQILNGMQFGPRQVGATVETSDKVYFFSCRQPLRVILAQPDLSNW